MSDKPKSSGKFRIFRVVFAIVVAWTVTFVCFHKELQTIGNAESNVKYWVALGVFASLISLFWAVKVNTETLYGRVSCAFELIVFNLILTFVLLELSLRAYSFVTKDPLTLSTNLKDAELVNERRKDKQKHVRFGFPFNSEGFHDTEFIRPKPDDVFRILALGDSYGVGAVPYSHNYLTLLEKELEGIVPGKRIEVCNVGMSTTAPQHYLSLMNQIGESLNPDLVLVGFFVGNDFDTNLTEDSFSSPWNALMVYRVPTRFYRMSQANTDYVTWAPMDEETKLVIPKFVDDWRLEKPTMPRDLYLQIQSHRAYIFNKTRDDDFFEYACGFVREIARDARKLTGKPLVVFVIPDANQVDQELRDEVDKFILEKTPNKADWSPDKWDTEKPNRFLSSAFDPEEIVLIDPLPVMREAQIELERTYHLNNTHWNANGNRAGAEELGRVLREKWEQITK